ncbi:DNA-3-methyladenine glycosylase I [Streptomyces sp. NPDC002722]|uniref:DNA-3-methyladenine glycosylase I n=1 Tax=unclassified Streptomyces TaxID=2593676 RepID=UPI0033298D35
MTQEASTTADPGVVVGEDGLARPAWAAVDPLLRDYYDCEWGMPVTDERGVHERVSLEGFQAGLSWATILRKRPAFRTAFNGFDPDVIATYTETDVERLMADAYIVRNRQKIQATIANARATIRLREDMGNRPRRESLRRCPAASRSTTGREGRRLCRTWLPPSREPSKERPSGALSAASPQSGFSTATGRRSGARPAAGSSTPTPTRSPRTWRCSRCRAGS